MDVEFSSLAELLELNHELCSWIEKQQANQLRTRQDFGHWLPVTAEKILGYRTFEMDEGIDLLKRLQHFPFDAITEQATESIAYRCESRFQDTVAMSAFSAINDIARETLRLRSSTGKELAERFKFAGKFTEPMPDSEHHPEWIEEFKQSEFWWPMRNAWNVPILHGTSVAELRSLADAELRKWWSCRKLVETAQDQSAEANNAGHENESIADVRENETKSEEPTYDWPEHYERDKWIHENVPLNSYDDTVTKLEKFVSKNGWEHITSRNQLRKIAVRFAKFHGYSEEIYFNGFTKGGVTHSSDTPVTG